MKKFGLRPSTAWLSTAIVACLTTSISLASEVSIIAEAGPLIVATPNYEARIEPDGCLTNLRVDGREFLAPGVAISRGSYFYQGGPLKLAVGQKDGDSSITARSDAASIRFEFSDADMAWQLTNKSAAPLVFFFVFTKDATAVFDANNVARAVPVNRSSNEATIVVGNSRLRIRGGDRLWGPWQGPHQVYEVKLGPQETKSLSLEVGQISEAERVKLVALEPTYVEPALQVLSPRNYQVLQRTDRNEALLNVSGHTTTDADTIRVRATGNSVNGPLPDQWIELKLDPATGGFEGESMVPAGGWYTLSVQALRDGDVIAETKVDKFGVGEVFVGGGQSNSTNFGETRTKQTSGMVSSFSGKDWRIADDPQPGVADESQGGSFWPAFGDAMYQRYGVPIGVATTGYGGTSVVQWQPDGDLFRWMMTRVHQLGPHRFRALLWHQGESDVEMPADEYYRKLRKVILSSRAQAGWNIPWFVAQTTYHNPQKLRAEPIREAQARTWRDGLALVGPDTDTLIGDCRDMGGLGIHLSPKGLKQHGEMWAERVGEYIDELGDSTQRKSSTQDFTVDAEPWPEADVLFHRDPQWLGGDDAYSLDLGKGRVAWFFGDSFVAPPRPGDRKGATMVHNSVGIQSGYDPTIADFKAYWQTVDGKPASFFPDDGKHYFWPGGSILIDGKLLVFFMQAWTKDPTDAMGFDTDGWAAILVDNPKDSPDQWRLERLDAPQNDLGVLVGSAAVVRDGDYLVAFSVGGKEHEVYLVRWRWSDAGAGDLSRPQWWSGSKLGWVAQSDLNQPPLPVIDHGQTEFTVSHSRELGRFLQFQFEGFPVSPIGVRTAPRLTGPWSKLLPCIQPDELLPASPGLMLYAAKAHPELKCDGLALTYASNTHKVEQLLDSATIYYPRFVRVKLERTAK